MGTPTPEVTIPTYARPQGGFASYSPPTAPSGLVVTPSTTSNALSWVSNSTNETGFQVERAAAAAGPFTVIATKTAGVTTHADTGLLPARYYYRVKALRDAQSSSYTTVVSGLVVSVSIPAAPLLGTITNLTGTAKRVAISSFPATADYVTREVSLNGGAYVSAGPDVLSGATFFDYDVGTATSWSFRSRAGNSAGLSTSYSNVVTGGSSIVVPAYTPFFKWSAAGRTPGSSVQHAGGWDWTSYTDGQSVYSNDILGPHGDVGVGKFTAVPTAITGDGESFFGGVIANNLSALNLVRGRDVWIRLYHYFPLPFCFSYATGGDGYGFTKWIRPGFADGSRFYFDIACGATACQATSQFRVNGVEGQTSGVADTLAGAVLTRGQWIAIQAHIRFGDASTGFVEMWFGSTYLGRATYNGGQQNFLTAPSGSPLQNIVFGDYWNGGPTKVETFYLDDFIFTSETPNTLDSGGRPFISPSTRASALS